MVFEAVYTMLNEFNIFGQGMYLVICGMMFAIARGISKSTEQFLMIAIIIGGFGTLILFKADFIKGAMFITTSILMIIYGLKYMDKTFEKEA